MKKILLVDDDEDLRSVIRDVVIEEGFSPAEAPDGVRAVEAFRNDPPDVVLLDMSMPHMNGLETLREMKKIDPRVPVIMLTAYGNIPTAVEAIKCGAYDFTTKPPEFDDLLITLKRAVERRDLEIEVERAQTALELSLEHSFGKSRAIKSIISQINQVVTTDFSIIIQGETGTGKSIVANAIHNMSKRAEGPFVRVDIGLIPDSLVESELFGYKRGAFTGAERNKTGYFETARGGTIFIDELENMSPHVQSKLLSVIERRKVYPLGSTDPVDIDVRVIAATNIDIVRSLKKKEFREDLFYRLGEFIITLPPLRERHEDIPFFAQKFLLEASAELNKQIRGISGEAVDLLVKHSWPGNLRELKNVMRRAVLITETDSISHEHLDLLMRSEYDESDPFSQPLKEAVRDLERKKIHDALRATGGNRTRAAELLKVSYKNMIDKIKEYGIE